MPAAKSKRREPEALRDPRRQAEDAVGHPVEGAEREQVPDVLVGDRAHPDVRVPQRPDPADEPVRVQVRVALGVGHHPPRMRSAASGRRRAARTRPARRRCGPAGPAIRRARRGRRDVHATARVRSPTPSSRGPLAPQMSPASAASEPEMVPPAHRRPVAVTALRRQGAGILTRSRRERCVCGALSPPRRAPRRRRGSRPPPPPPPPSSSRRPRR